MTLENKIEKKQKKLKKGKKEKKQKKQKKDKKSKHESSRKRKRCSISDKSDLVINDNLSATVSNENFVRSCIGRKKISFPIKYILAPMVGASELPFRLLCRKYGAHLAYTPMISSSSYVTSSIYRSTELQTIPQDRPLVVHFSANDPQTFARAAKMVEDKCDAIDLNLGCPQRTAYVGHFGSYLLDPKDRTLILNIIKAGNEAVGIPIFVKIRLLNSLEETIQLCQQLRDAGASLIAIHARYRASFERKGPGARDGPALLDQVQKIKKAVPDIPIISNGNVITYDDVEKNLDFTKADGIMSAEGILDNPALFLPQLGAKTEQKMISLQIPNSHKKTNIPSSTIPNSIDDNYGVEQQKKKRKIVKKLREIEKIEQKINTNGTKKGCIDDEQIKKIKSKKYLEQNLFKLEEEIRSSNQTTNNDNTDIKSDSMTKMVPLQELYETASDEIKLAKEYLQLTKIYPTKMRTQIFHTRRMCKDLLNNYQLMEECISSQSTSELENILHKIEKYRENPESFIYDKEKEKLEKVAMQRKRQEEGKRKAYEARMIRKAKREKRSDLEYYLRQGAEVPTVKTVAMLKTLAKEKQFESWKKGNHSQHCMAFHLGVCKRERSCAFLHVNATRANSFDEVEEVAG